MKRLIRLKVNGEIFEIYTEPWRTLAQVLREELGLTGVKVGCGEGNCGTCTILMDGMAVKSCLILIPQAQGKDILTIEGLVGQHKGLHPLQEAFIEHFAIQCGFCTPGMIMAAKALLDERPDATEEDVRVGLHGNLCRCTGYVKIIEAVLAARDKYTGRSFGESTEAEDPWSEE
jgi:aerobic-type carbon monoxide dehydrogenase small subunit (CoxS/CutS family)